MKTPARRKLLFIVLMLVLIGLAGYRFETTVVPQWRLQVVDEAGNPIPGTLVSQDWGDSYADREVHIEDRLTDSEGFVTFPRRKVRANLVMRALRTLASIVNPHGGSGASSLLTVTRPGEGSAVYSPDRPLPDKLVVRRTD